MGSLRSVVRSVGVRAPISNPELAPRLRGNDGGAAVVAERLRRNREFGDRARVELGVQGQCYAVEGGHGGGVMVGMGGEMGWFGGR